MTIETIPIDGEAALNKEPIHIEVTNMDAWPNQQLFIRLDWNEQFDRWIFEVEHGDDDMGLLFPRSPACLMREYWFWPYVMFTFLDISNRSKAVTPTTLGDQVVLGVFSGAGPEILGELANPEQRYE